MNRFEDDLEHDEDFEGNIFCQDQGGMQMKDADGQEGDCIYFCGIIDVLQKYNKRKKVENFFRGVECHSTSVVICPYQLTDGHVVFGFVCSAPAKD